MRSPGELPRVSPSRTVMVSTFAQEAALHAMRMVLSQADIALLLVAQLPAPRRLRLRR